jgi:hypothetical protein
MTLQAEQPVDVPDAPAEGVFRQRRKLIAAGLAAALAAGVAVVLGISSGTAGRPNAPVALGKSLAPVQVFRVTRLSEPRAGVHPGKNDRVIAVLGRPGMVVVTNGPPDQLLHVQYVHVRSIGGATQIEMAAPREAAFHDSRIGEEHYVAVIDGKAAALFFVFGSTDKTNFAVAGGANPISRADAIAFAHRSTTAVLIDR